MTMTIPTVLDPEDPGDTMALAVLSGATQALAAATTVSEVRDLRDQAAMFAEFVRRQKLGHEKQNDVAEFKLKCERRLGDMLAKTVEEGTRPLRDVITGELRGSEPSLPDGITPIQSLRWRRVALVSEEKFEAWVAEVRAAGDELTTAELFAMGQGIYDGQKAAEEKAAAIVIPAKPSPSIPAQDTGHFRYAPDSPDTSNNPEFKSVNEKLKTEYCCPQCGYEWSGNPKAGFVYHRESDDDEA